MTAHVTILGPLRHHYWLAVAMARASGADMVQAFADGRLSAEDWAQIVQRCRGCAWAQGCACWLRDAEPGAGHIPKACENHDILARIARDAPANSC